MSRDSLRIAVRVTDVVAVTPLVKRFHFESLDGAPLPNFSGGAHIIVEMREGESIRRNAYSLMSPPSRTDSYTISVRRDEAGRGGSRYLHDHVGRGAVLHISHPANLFPLERTARKNLFVAGGIGITPFLAMTEQLFHDGIPFELFYAIRSRDHAAYADELSARYGGRVHVYHSDRGERIPLDDMLRHQPLGTHLYICGPDRLIEHTVALARDQGWPDQCVHHERFLAPATGSPYQVKLARSALTIEVGSHESMLEAIEAAGVDAPYLCRGGACGQCQTSVLECDGSLVHHDHFLSEAEKASGATIMPCVSRVKGRSVTLDR